MIRGKLDARGRLVIPEPVRRTLSLDPGQEVVLETDPERRRLVLRMDRLDPFLEMARSPARVDRRRRRLLEPDALEAEQWGDTS